MPDPSAHFPQTPSFVHNAVFGPLLHGDLDSRRVELHLQRGAVGLLLTDDLIRHQ
jgi:hypothetical protein